ncbi:hypothetical protein ACFFSH_29845 [Streptomyces filamentosus]|uniref:hypothetical protein n=1 Tax=Streptomyces filamentosus TaxID=67294 RepID=UPI001E382C01|nr:hypothetical protein [Streptomyces filamentosus]
MPCQAGAGPAVLVRPPVKVLVRRLRQILHTGVYLATLHLPVGIVAWVYERQPRSRRRRLAPDLEPVLSLLWVGTVIGGLVLVVVITADAAATPAGSTPAASDHLAAEVQSPLAATNATAAPGGTGHATDGGRAEALGQFPARTSFLVPSAQPLYPAGPT